MNEYILDEHGHPILCPGTERWGQWMLKIENKRLALTRVCMCDISTVFLGIDHSFGDGPPILWETMVFDNNGSPLDQARYASKEAAIKGHALMVDRVQRGFYNEIKEEVT